VSGVRGEGSGVGGGTGQVLDDSGTAHHSARAAEAEHQQLLLLHTCVKTNRAHRHASQQQRHTHLQWRGQGTGTTGQSWRWCARPGRPVVFPNTRVQQPCSAGLWFAAARQPHCKHTHTHTHTHTHKCSTLRVQRQQQRERKPQASTHQTLPAQHKQHQQQRERKQHQRITAPAAQSAPHTPGRGSAS
jgi:hypothetical protein